MAIAYNTGTTKTVTNSGTPSGTVTIPAGVLTGDVLIILVMAFATATGTLANTLTSSATAPIQIGTSQLATGNGIQTLSSVYYIVAGASDPGATLTFGTTGGTGGAYWYNVGLVAYTGASNTGIPDCSNGTAFFATGQTGTTTTPAASTVTAGDWQVQLLGVGPPSGNSFTVPGSLTGRQAIGTGANAGLLLNIADSNASVGGAGTAIGNTTWTCGASGGNVWSTSFTVGLAPPGGSPPTPSPLTGPVLLRSHGAPAARPRTLTGAAAPPAPPPAPPAPFYLPRGPLRGRVPHWRAVITGIVMPPPGPPPGPPPFGGRRTRSAAGVRPAPAASRPAAAWSRPPGRSSRPRSIRRTPRPAARPRPGRAAYSARPGE